MDPECKGLTKFINERFNESSETVRKTTTVDQLVYGKVGPPSNHKVDLIHNPALFAAFVLMQKEYEVRGVEYEIQLLLHGTPTVNVESILSNNFDYRRCVKHMFGPGVYFTKSFFKAGACARRKIERNIKMNEYDQEYEGRSIVVGKVIVGNKEHRGAWRKIKSISIDTGVSCREKNFIKARDDEFLPVGFMKYDF